MHDSPTTKPPQTQQPKADLSPAMRQYQQFKAQYPNYVLFFRMGDFYEMFWEDAKTAAKTLGVVLTSRSRGGLNAEDAIPMAGVPFHAVESYLRKMIAAGHKVAICEQMEDPALAKGVVKRDVVRLMTPGTRTGWQFTQHHAREQIQKQWQARTAGGFGFADDDPAVLATAAVLSYLEETQKTSLAHIRPLRKHVVEEHLSIDPSSWRSLEIDRTIR